MGKIMPHYQRERTESLSKQDRSQVIEKKKNSFTRYSYLKGKLR